MSVSMPGSCKSWTCTCDCGCPCSCNCTQNAPCTGSSLQVAQASCPSGAQYPHKSPPLTISCCSVLFTINCSDAHDHVMLTIIVTLPCTIRMNAIFPHPDSDSHPAADCADVLGIRARRQHDGQHALSAQCELHRAA